MALPLISVLIVEDSVDDTEILLYELRRADFEVQYERVETAAGLRAALSRQPWDLVLSDYSLPRFSGALALQIVQDTRADIPFIIVSGAIGEEHAVEAMRAGARDYVMKDNLKRLVPAVKRELREAEERRAHRQANEVIIKLSQAMEQSASLVMITNVDGIIEYVNPAFCHVSGYSPEEVVGSHSHIVKSGMTPPETYAQMWNTILAGNSWRGQLLNRKKTGELFWVETTISSIKNQAGEITQFLAVQEDISEQKRLEAEILRYTTQLEKMVEDRTDQLRRAKEQIEIILENASDAIALARPNGDIETRNPAFIEMFGDQVARSIERILWIVADDMSLTQVGNALTGAFSEAIAQRLEAQIKSGDGNHRDIDLSLIPVQLADSHEQSSVLVNAHDITSLKEIERFKARFVADALHDLATPISGLSTRIYLLRRTPENMETHLRALENQVDHLRNLLNDLRFLSELDQDRLEINVQPCNINTIAARVFDSYEPVALSKGQILTLTAAPELPDALLDARQIERVLLNLVSNAINYTPDGKAIHMETAIESGALVFRVSDEGMGISPDDLNHIFERFYRASSARKAQIGGTGLGLSIVKNLVDLHQGTISVQSKPGTGSTFEVRIPITA